MLEDRIHVVPHAVVPRVFIKRSILLLEKAMAPHSSTLAWKILWMEEPGTAPYLNCSTQDFLVATGGI